jgi:hypothetical protein
MSREEFHRIYEAMPDDFKAELIAEGGVFKSRLFPGLWVDGDALFAKDGLRLTATLARGLATADHAAFVSHLKTRPGGAT